MSRNDALGCIREKIGEENLIGSCSRDGCQVFLTGIPSPRIIVDMDRVFSIRKARGNKCDFVLFFKAKGEKGVLAVPMELKSGDVDASKAVVQLQAGVAFADRIVKNFPGSRCRPILFYGGRFHRKQRSELNRVKISFRGQSLTIAAARCGQRGNLTTALSLGAKSQGT